MKKLSTGRCAARSYDLSTDDMLNNENAQRLQGMRRDLAISQIRKRCFDALQLLLHDRVRAGNLQIFDKYFAGLMKLDPNLGYEFVERFASVMSPDVVATYIENVTSARSRS